MFHCHVVVFGAAYWFTILTLGVCPCFPPTAVQSDLLFVGGEFELYLADAYNTTIYNFAMYNRTAEMWYMPGNFLGLRTGGGGILCFESHDTSLFMGGSFNVEFDDHVYNNLARYNFDTNIWLPFFPIIRGEHPTQYVASIEINVTNLASVGSAA
jgi:hypothetical protein